MTMSGTSRWKTLAARLAALGVLTLLFALALSRFPEGASIELRESRDMAIDFALRNGAQLGSDLLILEGPLAGFATDTHSTLPLWPQFWWQLFFNLALGGALAWVTLGMPRPQRWLFLLAYLFIAAYRPASAHAAAVLLGGMFLIARPVRWRESVPAGVVLGTLALLEAPLLLLGGAGILGALAVRGRSRAPAALALASWTAAIALGWWLAGQSFTHLGAWIWNGFTTLPGREIMRDATIWTAPMGCAAAGVAIAMILQGSRERQWSTPTGCVLVIFTGVALWALWLRNLGHLDGRPQDWFAVAFTIAAAWPGLLHGVAWRARWTALPLIIAALGIAWSEPRILTQPLIVLNQQLVQGVERFLQKSAWQRSVREKTKATAAVFGLERTRATAGDATVDVLGDAVGYAPLSQLNYRPRPTIQSVSAAGEKQLSRNAEYFRSARAPSFVLQRFSGETGWLPASADAEAQLALYYGYDFAFEDRTFLVWRRRTAPSTTPEAALVGTQSARWGEGIALNLQSDRGHWLRVQMRRTAWGMVRRWFWPTTGLVVALRDNEGNSVNYRLGADAARTGFLLHPFFRGEMDIIRYQAGLPTPLIAQLTFEADTSFRRAWRIEGIELHSLPLPPANGRTDTAEAIAARYRMSNRLPQSVSTVYPPAPVDYDGREVLLVSPEGTLEFPVHPGDSRVTGSFGIVGNAYTDGNASDGVVFVIEHHPVGGAVRELMRRTLDPLNEPADRGVHSFEVTLPRPASGRLLLRTTNEPGRNGAWDWSFWTDLRFE